MHIKLSLAVAPSILAGCSGKNEVAIDTGADFTTLGDTDVDTDADSDSDTDSDSDADTGSTTTGDTGATTTTPCDDYVARSVEVCWSALPDFPNAQDGRLMIWDYTLGDWVDAATVSGPFAEICGSTQAATGAWLKVQVEFHDYAVGETPAELWWAIANWYGDVLAKGTWTIDDLPVEVDIYNNDGQIAVPACP